MTAQGLGRNVQGMENTNRTETESVNGFTYKIHGNGIYFCAEYRNDSAKTDRFNVFRINSKIGRNVGTYAECVAAVEAHKDSIGFQPDEKANAEFYAGLRH